MELSGFARRVLRSRLDAIVAPRAVSSRLKGILRELLNAIFVLAEAQCPRGMVNL